eukprot:gene20771-61406_t
MPSFVMAPQMVPVMMMMPAANAPVMMMPAPVAPIALGGQTGAAPLGGAGVGGAARTMEAKAVPADVDDDAPPLS